MEAHSCYVTRAKSDIQIKGLLQYFNSSLVELAHLQFVFQILHLFPRLIYFKTRWNYLDHPVWPPVLRTLVWQETYFPERHAVWEGYFQLWYVSVVIVYAIETWGADVSILPRYTPPHCSLSAWLCPVVTVREIYRNVTWRNSFLADIWKHPCVLSDFKQNCWTRDVQISEVAMQKWISFYAKRLNAEPLSPRDQCFVRMLYCHEWVWTSLRINVAPFLCIRTDQKQVHCKTKSRYLARRCLSEMHRSFSFLWKQKSKY